MLQWACSIWLHTILFTETLRQRIACMFIQHVHSCYQKFICAHHAGVYVTMENPLVLANFAHSVHLITHDCMFNSSHKLEDLWWQLVSIVQACAQIVPLVTRYSFCGAFVGCQVVSWFLNFCIEYNIHWYCHCSFQYL